MTCSEFGRRPEENGDDGTDHGTAAPLFVIGDHVKGGLHGVQPSLTEPRRRREPEAQVDFRQVYARCCTPGSAPTTPRFSVTRTRNQRSSSGPPAAPRSAYDKASWGYWMASPTGRAARVRRRAEVRLASRPRHRSSRGVSTKTRLGLWLCTTKGHVYTFGDAHNHGGASKLHLNKPIVAMAATPTRQRLLALRGRRRHLLVRRRALLRVDRQHPAQQADRRHDGEPDRQGLLVLRGRRRHLRLRRREVSTARPAACTSTEPIVGMAASPTGKGYWLVAANGAVYAFGDAKGHGSASHLASTVCGIAPTLTGSGYWIADHAGTALSFGDAPVLGSSHTSTAVLIRA